MGAAAVAAAVAAVDAELIVGISNTAAAATEKNKFTII